MPHFPTRSDASTSDRAPELDGHRSAERRSLAMHRLIAERLDEQALARAQARVAEWLRDGGPVNPHWAAAWDTALDGTVESVAGRIGQDDDATRQLRQTSPFAGTLSNAERWRVLREVR